MMRITAYSDRLLDDLDVLDWPEQGQNHAAQLDRPIHRRGQALFSAARAMATSTSRCSPPGRTPCSAQPIWCWRPSTSWSTAWSPPQWPDGVDPRWTYGAATPGAGRRRLPAGHRREVRPGASGEQGQDRRLPGQLRDQPGQRRAGADLHRRLRAGRIRHRGDHGRPRPRPARLGVRPRVRPADRRSHCRRRSFRRPLMPATASWSTRVTSTG